MVRKQDNYATQELKKARDSFFDEPNDVMPDLVKDHGNVLVYDEDEEYEKQMKEAIARSLRGGQWWFDSGEDLITLSRISLRADGLVTWLLLPV